MEPVISLWDFALALYTRPGVAPLCLALQDKHGANVNLVLFSCWLEVRQLPLDLPAALACVSTWETRYVQPLRALRRQMKQEFAANLAEVAEVREQIKRAELSAERQELHWLEQLASEWQSAPACAGDNLALYLRHLQVPEQELATSVQALLN